MTKSSSVCSFCAISQGTQAAHIVSEDAHALAFLDRRPLFVGHCLVIPRDHFATLEALPDMLVAACFGLAQRLSRALPEALGAQGTFVAMNNVVSQSVAHAHIHVVPRTRGDGLRGFFWPRVSYRDELHAASTARQIGAVMHRQAHTTTA